MLIIIAGFPGLFIYRLLRGLAHQIETICSLDGLRAARFRGCGGAGTDPVIFGTAPYAFGLISLIVGNPVGPDVRVTSILGSTYEKRGRA